MPTARLVRPLLGLLLAVLAGCSTLMPSDPLTIDLVGLEPLPGEGLEARFALKLRVQNPNESAVEFNGLALQLDINDQPLARGVSDQSGRIERFSETLIKVPMTISAYSMLRQAWGASNHQPGHGLPYTLRGKLAGGVFGTRRFVDSGTLDWPEPAPPNGGAR